MQKSAIITEKLCKKIENNEDYANFVSLLKDFSKNESIEDLVRHKAIINSNQEIIGIEMKTIRDIAKQIARLGSDKFLEIARNKKPQNSYYEETLIEGLVIAEIKDLDLQISLLKNWVHKIDNWGTCDSVVTTLKRLKKSPQKYEYFEIFEKMSLSDKEFVARFGIVTMMSIYLTKESISKIYEIIKSIKNNTYYVKMAAAWLIASGFLIDKDLTISLLKERVLDKFVQNKAISKCRDSYQVSAQDKNNLIQFRM